MFALCNSLDEVLTSQPHVFALVITCVYAVQRSTIYSDYIGIYFTLSCVSLVASVVISVIVLMGLSLSVIYFLKGKHCKTFMNILLLITGITGVLMALIFIAVFVMCFISYDTSVSLSTDSLRTIEHDVWDLV